MPLDFTSLLKDWGFTLGLLSVAATAIAFIFVLCLREFSFWFLKIDQVLKNQEAILARLTALEQISKRNLEPNLNQPEESLIHVLPKRKETFQLHS